MEVLELDGASLITLEVPRGESDVAEDFMSNALRVGGNAGPIIDIGLFV